MWYSVAMGNLDLRLRHVNELTNSELERLALLGEELGEAAQIVGKILRHGYKSTNPLTPDTQIPISNRELLCEELAHVLFAIRLMAVNDDVNPAIMEHMMRSKESRIGRWLHYNHKPVTQVPPRSENTCCGGVGCNSCEPRGNYNY